jgi:hypothetical protein
LRRDKLFRLSYTETQFVLSFGIFVPQGKFSGSKIASNRNAIGGQNSHGGKASRLEMNHAKFMQEFV